MSPFGCNLESLPQFYTRLEAALQKKAFQRPNLAEQRILWVRYLCIYKRWINYRHATAKPCRCNFCRVNIWRKSAQWALTMFNAGYINRGCSYITRLGAPHLRCGRTSKSYYVKSCPGFNDELTVWLTESPCVWPQLEVYSFVVISIASNWPTAFRHRCHRHYANHFKASVVQVNVNKMTDTTSFNEDPRCGQLL